MSSTEILINSTGLSGSLQRLASGETYLVAGENVQIVTGSNGQVRVSAASSLSGSFDLLSKLSNLLEVNVNLIKTSMNNVPGYLLFFTDGLPILNVSKVVTLISPQYGVDDLGESTFQVNDQASGGIFNDRVGQPTILKQPLLSYDTPSGTPAWICNTTSSLKFNHNSNDLSMPASNEGLISCWVRHDTFVNFPTLFSITDGTNYLQMFWQTHDSISINSTGGANKLFSVPTVSSNWNYYEFKYNNTDKWKVFVNFIEMSVTGSSAGTLTWPTLSGGTPDSYCLGRADKCFVGGLGNFTVCHGSVTEEERELIANFNSPITGSLIF